MTSVIKADQQYFSIANRRFDTLVDFALTVGAEIAKSEQEQASLARISKARDAWWPGYTLDLGEEFPNLEERKFWAIVFNEIAWRVFDRRIGNQEDSTWQVSVISECQLISIFLHMLVWKGDRLWHAERRTIEHDGMRPDPLRIKGGFA